MADALTAPAAETARVVRRRRALPGTRAVVGALLIVVAAVGVFAAYLSATAAPTTGYLVAARDIAEGDVVTAADLTVAFVDLEAEQAGTILRDRQLDDVVGTTAAVPIGTGAFVLGSMVRPAGALDGELFSFSVPASRALGGNIRPAMTVDLLATYGSGEDAQTVYLIRGVRVTDTGASTGSLGGGATLLTVLLPDPAAVQRVAHALGNAEVWVTRSGSGDDLPSTYTFNGR